MSQRFIKTKPSFLEAGLPCASLSAECQRDNNARERPPQNRLHIWWARRPPTISRVAILSALLPHDFKIEDELLPTEVSEPTAADLETLAGKYQRLKDFFARLLTDVPATVLPRQHWVLLRTLGICGDADRAYRRLVLAEDADNGRRVTLGSVWGYCHPRAFAVAPGTALLATWQQIARQMLGLNADEPLTMLDSAAGGGSIPLEGIRYGLKVYANDLNPVAALVLKATLEYPTRFGRSLAGDIRRYALQAHAAVRDRLQRFFPFEDPKIWWPEEEAQATILFRSKDITRREPATDHDPIRNTWFWFRTIPCPKCHLNIPLSTNFLISTKKKDPEASLALFPEVPDQQTGNACTFRIVRRAVWAECKWPGLHGGQWHPRTTPTCSNGRAVCPRCGNVMGEQDVKKYARSLEDKGGLSCQLAAVCSRVPIRVTYKNTDVKIRYLWRFRLTTQGDIDAVTAAQEELQRRRPHWSNLVPGEEVPEIMEDKRPREYGMKHWRDFFLPRQLLVNTTVLEEVRHAQARARAELPPDKAEAVAVYLAFMVSKVLNYNCVSSSWHDGRRQIRGMMMAHDFRFHPSFTEMEGARETVMWGANQVIGAYEAIAGLIHGEDVSLQGGDDQDADAPEDTDSLDNSQDEETGEENGAANEEVTLPHASAGIGHIRPEVVIPTITCDDAAALDTPVPGSVHLICIDPPYYANVQYSELSNFFYVWLKRALGDWPGLEHLFREELAESNREAVANAARWRRDADADLAAWKARYEDALEKLKDARNPETNRKWTKPNRERLAREQVGPEPPTASDRADQFYEDKMAAVFRRAKQLLHPAGRMVVMFNHKMTKAWRALGAALIREGFDIRTSIPIHTEAESSLNIRGLDAARSTVLLLCLPREETGQVTGNWGRVQNRVAEVARSAAQRFQGQGLSGTDLYLSALGPALGEVGKHWPITDMAGRPIDLGIALDEAYKAVGRFRLAQILEELTGQAAFADVSEGFSADSVDKNTQSLWLWLDTFQGDVADSDDVRKLAKSLDIEPDSFRKLKLLDADGDIFTLKPPQQVSLGLLARNLVGGQVRSARDREAREADVWDERTFPGFLGAAVWNGIGLMAGGEEHHRGLEALKQWQRNSGYAEDRNFRGAFGVTLHLLRQAFGKRRAGDAWHEATQQAGAAWDLAIKGGRR